jgi:hypothetical protein
MMMMMMMMMMVNDFSAIDTLLAINIMASKEQEQGIGKTIDKTLSIDYLYRYIYDIYMHHHIHIHVYYMCLWIEADHMRATPGFVTT